MPMLEEMILDLKNAKGRNAKIAILKQYFANDPNIVKIVQMTYDPMRNFNITKPKADKVGTKYLIDVYPQLFQVLNLLSEGNVRGNKAKELCANFMNELTEDSQKVFLRIINKDLKCGIAIETINTAAPGLIEPFSVQLANKYDSTKDYKLKPDENWYGSTKLDGIRCMYLSKYPDKVFSRQGKAFTGLEHIIKDLQVLVSRMKEQPEFASMPPDSLFADGELFSDDISFNEIQGIVLSTKNVDDEKKKSIYLKCFAIGPVKTTADMVKFYKDPFLFEGLTSVKPIEYFEVKNNAEEIMRMTRELVGKGYEGLMLRHPRVPYDWKRSNNLLKSKLHKETEAELIITAINPGRPGTKYESTMGTLTCEGSVKDPLYTDGKRLTGEFNVECDVGSGFSDEERDEIWANQDDYLGKEIILNYQCLSQNAATGKYSLRFPTKKGFKLDR